MEPAMPTYTVIGTDKESMAPRRVQVEAEGDIAARQRANAMGVLVSDVIDPGPRSAPRTAHFDESEREHNRYLKLLRSPEHRAMKRAAFVGTLWALVVFTLAMAVLRLGWFVLARG
jgi:hypothetical protein